MQKTKYWMQSVCMTIALLGGGLALAVDQPMPKPLTPPPVVPGEKPPSKPAPLPPAPVPAVAPAAAPNVVGDQPIIGDDAAVLPFLDEEALLVVRVDESALDLQPVSDWLADVVGDSKVAAEQLGDAKKRILKPLDIAGKWTQKFREAGGKRLYAIVKMDSGPFVIVPLEKNADAKALLALFNGSSTKELAAVMGNAVVFSALPGELRHLAAAAPAKLKPEFAAAMAAAGDAPVRAVLIPTEAFRDAVEGVASSPLVDQLGIKPHMLSDGIRWMSASLTPPPRAAFSLIVQARDAATATDLKAFTEKGTTWLKKLDRPDLSVSKIFEAFDFKPEGDRLTLHLDRDQLRSIAVITIPAFFKAQDQARLARQENAARQLYNGFLLYTNANDEKWPAALEDIAPYVGGPEMLARLTKGNPSDGRPAHFVYHKLTGRMSHTPLTAVVVYEEAEEGHTLHEIVVGYADGHVEVVSPEVLKKQLEPAAEK